MEYQCPTIEPPPQEPLIEKLLDDVHQCPQRHIRLRILGTCFIALLAIVVRQSFSRDLQVRLYAAPTHVRTSAVAMRTVTPSNPEHHVLAPKALHTNGAAVSQASAVEPGMPLPTHPHWPSARSCNTIVGSVCLVLALGLFSWMRHGSDIVVASASGARQTIFSRMTRQQEVRPQTVWVFSYGANLCKERMRQRDMTPLGCVNVVLPGHRLTFNHRFGYGNVMPCDTPGACVHGVALELTIPDFRRLKQAEYGYEVTRCVMQTYPDDGPGGKGRGLFGVVFVATNLSRAPTGELESIPSYRYMMLIRQGCRDHDLDRGYTQWVDEVASIYKKGWRVEPEPFVRVDPGLLEP
uniref:gamma-glutamylcyclotransferase n=1 Tax=Eutreptiella gymnastica TaxID=73025 RepID=A0A7S4CKC0_9EUGL